MKKLLVVLAVVGLVAPMAQAEFFKVTGDGAFDTYRSVSNNIEGYTNAGAQTGVRMGKSNQHNGWLSFKDAVADGSGQSLSAFLAANPSAQAFIYLRMKEAVPADAKAYAISIRTGNQGNLVEDQNTTGVGTMAAPAAGFTGASELVAWRGAAPYPGTSFLKFGSGIYTVDDPNSTAGTQGQPWITPSTRLPNTGASPFKWGPNQEVRYDTGIMKNSAGTDPATGKYLGFFPDTLNGSGRSYWALEDVLGMYNNNARSATTASVTAAGQIMIGGNEAPTLISNALVANAADPRNGVVADWMAIPVDAAFLADMANNAENKGIYFANNFSGITASFSNWGYYTKEQNDASTPYLYVTPEPATMILLALGGLVALRRRSA